MGGSIRVQSPGPEGLGTEFTASLPITHNAEAAAQAPLDQLDSIPATDSDGLTPSHPVTTPETMQEDSSLPLLLLIEDNHDVVTYLKTCLEDRYTIDWAANGALGIERALEIIPDIIISDIMMPEKDGYEVCHTLKNDERTSHIPIILLTAKAHVESRLQGLRLGADAYLGKPFLKEELYIRLEKLIELRQKLQARYSRSPIVPVGAPPENVPAEPTLNDLFLQKIRDLVEANLSDSEFGNEQLARALLLSQSQLFRKLKALTGRSVAIHIRGIRLQKSMELLQNTQMTISEIAYETGFSDPFYFSRTFSEAFGVSPTNARK